MGQGRVKHVVMLVATVAAFGVSMYLLQTAIGPRSPWFAFMVLLCFLGLAKIADPVYRLKVPRGLWRLRPWELAGDVYRRLGVAQFGALLRNTPLRVFNLEVYVSRHRGNLPRIYGLIEAAEAAHVWSAVLLLPYLAYCAWSGRWEVFAWFVVAQVVGNAYPIMHLRMVRGRLDRVLRRR